MNTSLTITLKICCIAVMFLINIKHASANCETIVPVELDSVTNGVLEFSDCTLDDGTLGDLYSITLPSSGNVSILLSSTDFDPWLFLFDENLNPIADNDDISEVDLNSRIDLNLEAGTYIILTNEFSLATGTYSLTVFSDVVENQNCDVSTELILNSSANGTLSEDDCTIREFSGATDDSFIDIYNLTLAQSSNLIIELSSTVIDSFLWVISEDGSIVEVDDNSGENSNARLDVILPAGNHTVLANSFNIETGGYTLSNYLFIDTDNDSIDDTNDNCPDVSNTNQLDNDSDGIGDICDNDDDNDGLSDNEEADLGTNPLLKDTDNDGVGDLDEVNQGRNPILNEAAIILIINSLE